ncbi:xanthocillin biosynthesis cluster protein xanF [Aspergillus clavatus NRRL 1]|uniref:Uncharacterized protein n=1 Tax=Aspergillus clavatus (strain ATCC 1007 / CBS 513.65 / DSM 816 / NCTC 3887 / NRRL 1 / QM 1276 / 107) TaxID=344612 RepID=A1C574_ASPCL|nr:uncharacterized protein ACLA_002530 [Aspergillus clavatus NRRL 1]EAW14842.1 conserved hypothetical protein [Aspergillus clavatus NRRL 1]
MASEVLQLHRDRLSADELNLKDPYVSSSLALFAIHNVVRRNLTACAEHAKSVDAANIEPFVYYAKYTLHVVQDQLESVDHIWFPVFSEHDNRFTDQTTAHEPLYKRIAELESLLNGEPASLEQSLRTEVADGFQQLHELVDKQYEVEEALVNELGSKIPIKTIRGLEKQQEQRRRQDVKVYGQLWTAVYLLRGLAPKERAIFPPGIPKLVLNGMLTAGALQFRRELQFTPRF